MSINLLSVFTELYSELCSLFQGFSVLSVGLSVPSECVEVTAFIPENNNLYKHFDRIVSPVRRFPNAQTHQSALISRRLKCTRIGFRGVATRL